MWHRTSIFRKLRTANNFDIPDAVNRSGTQIRGKLLIPEYRQSLFQTKLKPVATSNPVTCPIMEVFMTDHSFNIKVVGVSCRFRVCENKFGIKNIQPFVFHRAHVEKINRHDHVNIQVVFKSEPLFIPGHGFFQAAHRMITTVQVSLIDKQF